MWPQTIGTVCRHILHNRNQLPNLFERVLLPSLQLTAVQQNRNVVILKRRWPMRPAPLGKVRSPTKKSQLVMEVVEDTIVHAPKTLKVILVDDVSNVGLRGDMVEVQKKIGRKLIREELAVYASPENIKEMAEKKKEMEGEKRLSQLAHQTISRLQKRSLIVELYPEAKWEEIPKGQIIHAFRRNFRVHVPDYALTMPEEPITACGTYTVHVTINGITTIPVQVEVKTKLTQEDIDRQNFQKLFE